MSESPNKPTGPAISEQGLADLRAEIEGLEGRGRREMAARIKAARELGDLSENAEYHIAKDDQAHLETKIKRLRAQLQSAEVIEVDTDADTFAFGRTAEVLDEESGKVHTWTLVGAPEADPTAGRLSVEAPIGAALRDAPVGESINVETPGGTKAYRVQKLV
ncbi:MAG TPA: transcription elongation factor GreA [Solirubrobacterales bacterium]